MTQTQSVSPSVRTGARPEPISALRREGWVQLRGFFGEDDLALLRDQVSALASTVDPELSPWDAQVQRISDATRRNVYQGLRYLPALMGLATQPSVLDLVSELGLEQPAIMQSHNVRMDGPGDDDHLFQWHQDFTYFLGSPNAVTLWIPLTHTDAIRGSIQIVPHSHRQGVLPVTPMTSRHVRADTALSPRDLVLQEEPSTEHTVVIEADPGDVIVLSMFAVHRSTPNLSDRIRWTAQLRYADFASPGFQEAGFPFGDATNIFHCGYRGAFYDPER